MNNSPQVSIVIPAYNASNYLAQAIDSALAQTYENIEIIVVNDGSKDNGATREVAQRYGDRIRYYEKENGGVSSALNYGIQHMKGAYFSWLSHDDLYTKDKIQMQVAALSGCQDNAVAYCKSNTIDKNSKLIKESTAVFPNDRLSPEEAVMYAINHGMGGCAFLIPRIAFEKVGLFDENLRYCQDIFMWWKIFLAGFSVAFCHGVGVSSRVHANQLTQTGSALYHHDAQYIGERIVPSFANVSTPACHILYAYAKSEAKHDNGGVVSLCIQHGTEHKMLTKRQILTIRCVQLYGKVRPLIRRVYYFIFRGIRTK